MAYTIIVGICALLLGICLGFIFHAPIQRFITNLATDDELLDTEEEEEIVLYEFDESDSIEDDNGELKAHPFNVIELSTELEVTIPAPEQKDSCYHYNLSYRDVFDEDEPKHLAITFRYTDFSQAELDDEHFESFVQYLCMAKLWNKCAINNPKQLPWLADDTSSLNLPFKELYGYICGITE